MRRYLGVAILSILILMTGILPLVTPTEARSVHSTNSVDLFPQGTFTQPSQWSTGAETSFTQATATYTDGMVADQRLSIIHQRPMHLDTMTIWSSSSPTNSSYSVGAPDGASTWSTGPDIQLTDFGVSGLQNYQLVAIWMKAVIQIPDALQKDTVRISVQHANGFDLLKTFAHTQGNVDYINNSAFMVNITGLMNWTWNDVSSMIFTLDYVAAGGVDDSRLVVDALGLDITVKTPWYGGEVGFASSTFSGHDMPILGLNLEEGTTTNLALDSCGLKPVVQGTTGQWESGIITQPPEQQLGRVHLLASEGELENISLEVALSNDGEIFGDYSTLDENTLLPSASSYRIRISVIDACLEAVWVDINDPTLSLSGRIVGNNDGIDADYSRWLVFVNGEVVANEAMTASTFSHHWPIGAYLMPQDEEVTVSIRAWFTWDSDGSESDSVLEINSISIQGGFAVQWDEDPQCEAIGDQYLTEDNGGLILPLLRRCSDDRAGIDDWTVQFANTNTNLVEVDLAEGDVRLRLLSEASGQAVISVKVLDPAGNFWQDTFTLAVEPVDDPPEVSEFPALIPVERDETTLIDLSWIDIDSTSVSASTNRTWATVDLASNVLAVTPPTVGFHTVLLSVCDQTTCTEREIDLEVMALADLTIESIDFGADELTQGEVIAMRVLVRNQGQESAMMVSVRCETGDQLIAVAIIPEIQPGELRAVVCDWQIPQDAKVIRFHAVVDKGLSIPEGNEDNNDLEQLMSITELLDVNNEQETGASGQALMIGSIMLSFALLALLIYMMPAKIKKIE